VLFDNVVTTGGTFVATARLLRRFAPTCVIAEAIVMFTEGYKPFAEIDCGVCTVPVVSLGGHIPIFAESQIVGGKVLRPPQFYYKSSARFPTTFAPDKNILFSVFENEAGVPAIAMVGPGTFSAKSKEESFGELHRDVVVRIHDACATSASNWKWRCK
jgi:hypothetical protein